MRRITTILIRIRGEGEEGGNRDYNKENILYYNDTTTTIRMNDLTYQVTPTLHIYNNRHIPPHPPVTTTNANYDEDLNDHDHNPRRGSSSSSSPYNNTQYHIINNDNNVIIMVQRLIDAIIQLMNTGNMSQTEVMMMITTTTTTTTTTATMTDTLILLSGY